MTGETQACLQRNPSIDAGRPCAFARKEAAPSFEALFVPHIDASDLAESGRVCPSPRPSQRIILLSGESWAADCHFHMEATIFAAPGGKAAGEILWTNIDTSRAPSDMAVTEVVEGHAGPARLAFAGQRIDPLLVCERYRIDLYGDGESGAFIGVSSAFTKWDGTLSGTYQVVDQPLA